MSGGVGEKFLLRNKTHFKFFRIITFATARKSLVCVLKNNTQNAYSDPFLIYHLISKSAAFITSVFLLHNVIKYCLFPWPCFPDDRQKGLFMYLWLHFHCKLCFLWYEKSFAGSQVFKIDKTQKIKGHIVSTSHPNQKVLRK